MVPVCALTSRELGNCSLFFWSFFHSRVVFWFNGISIAKGSVRIWEKIADQETFPRSTQKERRVVKGSG